MRDILERLERKMDAGFEQVDKRFEQVEGRLGQVEGRLGQVEGRLGQVEGRLEQVEGRLGQVDGRLGQIDVQLDEGRERDRGFERSFSAIDAQLQKQGVLLEDIRGDAKMALEGIIGNREATDKGFADVLRTLNERVQPIELASRQFGRQLNTRAKGKRRSGPA
jgi:chromosome segregation ATPase